MAYMSIICERNEKFLILSMNVVMRCDFIAEGIIEAANEIEMNVPLIVRLAGTNVELGKKMLSESGLDLIPAGDMDDGAKKAIKAIGGNI